MSAELDVEGLIQEQRRWLKESGYNPDLYDWEVRQDVRGRPVLVKTKPDGEEVHTSLFRENP